MGEHHATDVYRYWKRALAGAEDSAVIFTPYLDALLPRLLTSAPDIDITVVTDLSPQSGVQDYLGQLRALKKLLAADIDVRTLDRVHAKILWVDDGRVIYGSQNFTTYARNSREASTTPTEDLTGTTFIATLQQWLEASTPIDEELIDWLLTQVASQAKELQVAQRALLATVDGAIEAYAQQQEQREQAQQQAAALRMPDERFQDLTRTIRHPQGVAIVRRAYKVSNDWRGFYDTMEADGTNDLTRWIVEEPGEGPRTLVVDKALMYPTLFTDNGRLAFVRVMKTRITYVRFSVGPLNIGRIHRTRKGETTSIGWTATVDIDLPDEVHNGSNLTLNFHVMNLYLPDIRFPVQVDAHFDAETLTVLRSTQHPAEVIATGGLAGDIASARLGGPEEPRELIEAFLNTDDKRRAFVRSHLEPFRYTKLRIEDKNTEEIFTEDRYELALTQASGTPVLLAREPNPFTRW